jgi:hypothetical protein
MRGRSGRHRQEDVKNGLGLRQRAAGPVGYPRIAVLALIGVLPRLIAHELVRCDGRSGRGTRRHVSLPEPASEGGEARCLLSGRRLGGRLSPELCGAADLGQNLTSRTSGVLPLETCDRELLLFPLANRPEKCGSCILTRLEGTVRYSYWSQPTDHRAALWRVDRQHPCTSCNEGTLGQEARAANPRAGGSSVAGRTRRRSTVVMRR